MIIKNAKIYTMGEKGIIENGFIKTEEKIITQVDIMDKYTEDDNEKVIDAMGKWLFPGFIDAHTHLGMYEDGIRNEGDDLNEVTDPQTPQLRAIDAINPIDRTFIEAMEAGITCVATGPGSANPIGGQFAVIKTYGRRIDDMIIRTPASIKFALGENPKMCYGNKNQMPETRMATAAVIRDSLRKAKKYNDDKIKAKETAGTDEPSDEPDYDMKSEALLPLINGEIKAHIHAHRADDIFTAIRLSKEFDLKYTLVHCTEGHLIAEELAEENAHAIVGPIICDRSKPEMKNLELKNAKILSEAGILFALTTDHPVAPIQYLPYCAALTVKAGLDMYEAFKALTINPAKILNIDDFVGSLEAGKHADMVLYSDNPLNILSNAEIVIIDGKIVKN